MKVNVHYRDELGTSASSRYRNDKQIPAVIYGKGIDSIPVLFDKKELEKVLKELGGNAIFDAALEDGKSYQVIMREIQEFALKNEFQHVSLQVLTVGEKIKVEVPVTITGAENIDEGITEQHLYEVEIETLPTDIPNEFTFDVSELTIGDSVTIADLSVPEKVEILSESDVVVANVSAPSVYEEEEETDEETPEPELIGEEDEE